ncbi:ferredoxin [Chlorella sorokiniana]|uniref:Ferredoxin n=1 Tax=Chlorella sorokiniana TaxID=3076 RepID=A0A2P6U438_CHLSO|nr:ferredoxin [Chlorella sorokiniana]|eukprot:PRW61066.1 ferredoxin [Chlorella sorokiniana]
MSSACGGLSSLDSLPFLIGKGVGIMVAAVLRAAAALPWRRADPLRLRALPAVLLVELLAHWTGAVIAQQAWVIRCSLPGAATITAWAHGGLAADGLIEGQAVLPALRDLAWLTFGTTFIELGMFKLAASFKR